MNTLNLVAGISLVALSVIGLLVVPDSTVSASQAEERAAGQARVSDASPALSDDARADLGSSTDALETSPTGRLAFARR